MFLKTWQSTYPFMSLTSNQHQNIFTSKWHDITHDSTHDMYQCVLFGAARSRELNRKTGVAVHDKKYKERYVKSKLKNITYIYIYLWYLWGKDFSRVLDSLCAMPVLSASKLVPGPTLLTHFPSLTSFVRISFSQWSHFPPHCPSSCQI